ncbi:MAG: hydroxymethylglutaryl-CoA reductase (NADPH) [archaeon]
MDDFVDKIVKGKMKMHEVEALLSSKEAVDVRRRAVERLTGTKLENVSFFSVDTDVACRKNIENMIGVTQVPLGVAGPLKVEGEIAKGDYYVPLATTEGALIASVNRGCSAATKSGGVRVYVQNKGMTRAPVFRTSGLKESHEFVSWTKKNFSRIKKVAESTTKYGKLMEIQPWIVGRNVFLRFVFDTKDAMGMNMAVIACDAVVRELVDKETKVKCISLSGNMCTDKKPSAINFISGRGKSVHAEAIIRKDIVEKVLKTNPKNIFEVNYRKNLLGSAVASSLGFNAHYGNIAAALFLACGQDIAHVTEAAMGVTTCEMLDDDLYISIYMPNLNVGTVGGGTGLGTQKEALRMLGVSGASLKPGENAHKFAEIVGAAVLCGELSLLSAFTSRDVAKAHVKYGRGK